MSVIPSVLQDALDRLLKVRDGDEYSANEFRNAMGEFLRALRKIPTAEDFLEKYGTLVERTTAADTDYASAWQRGYRRGLQIMPNLVLLPKRVRAGGMVEEFLLLNPRVVVWLGSGVKSWMNLRRTSRQKSWLHELREEHSRIEDLLNWLQRGREVAGGLPPDRTRYWFLCKDFCGTQEDLKSWRFEGKAVVSEGDKHHVDGYKFLYEFKEHGLGSDAVGGISFPSLGSQWVRPVQVAAEFLVEKLETTNEMPVMGRDRPRTEKASPRDDPAKKEPRLKNWAVAVESNGTWWLYHWYPNHKQWRQEGKTTIPRGRATRLALALAEHGGSISKSEAVSLFRTAENPGRSTKSIYDSVCVPARRDLVEAIRGAVARAAGSIPITANPIPWDQHSSSWQCVVKIGYAVPDDEDRLVFRTHEQLTDDEKMDAEPAR